MPAKPKAKPRNDKASRKFYFELLEDEGWLSIEISQRNPSGVIKVYKLGEDQKEVAVGSVMLMRMLGEEGIDVFEKHIPIEIFWTNLALLKHSPEYVYWMHAADFDDAVRAGRKMSDRVARWLFGADTIARSAE
jgi:hypothetical protein